MSYTTFMIVQQSGFGWLESVKSQAEGDDSPKNYGVAPYLGILIQRHA